MPGCWLKKGENEIIVLDLKGPQQAIVKGLKKPILDMLREKAPETHRKSGQKLELQNETAAAQGTFTLRNGWQEEVRQASTRTLFLSGRTIFFRWQQYSFCCRASRIGSRRSATIP